MISNDTKLLSEEELASWQEELEKKKKELKRQEDNLEAEKKLFEQKLQILKISYSQLASEKYALDRDRLKFEAEKKNYQGGYDDPEYVYNQAKAVSFFFKGVTNILALKKRYKDLIKIFHPDNLCGDKDTIQMINMEYETLKKKLDIRSKEA